jgi:hypothetical protein
MQSLQGPKVIISKMGIFVKQNFQRGQLFFDMPIFVRFQTYLALLRDLSCSPMALLNLS